MLKFFWPLGFYFAPGEGGGGGGGDGDPDAKGGGDPKGPNGKEDPEGAEGDDQEVLDDDDTEEDEDPYKDLTPKQLKERLKDKDNLVGKLRKESKGRRIKLQNLEKADAKRKKSEMTAVEKAEAERDEEKIRADAAESELKVIRVERVIEKQAIKMKIKKPHLALRLMDLDEIKMDDDGEVDERSVVKILKTLVKDVPELLGKSSKPDLEGEEDGKGPGDLDVDESELRSVFGLRSKPQQERK